MNNIWLTNCKGTKKFSGLYLYHSFKKIVVKVPQLSHCN